MQVTDEFSIQEIHRLKSYIVELDPTMVSDLPLSG